MPLPRILMRASKATLPLLGLSSSTGILALSSPPSTCSRFTSFATLSYPQCPTATIAPAAAAAPYSTAATSPSYTYRLAASFSAKDTYYKPHTSDTYTFTPSRPSHKHYNHRKPSLRANSGQDAFFITSVGNNSSSSTGTGAGTVAFGIADGVGGWIESGVDPADFSHGLCHYMSSRAEASSSPDQAGLKPGTLLQNAYNDVLSDTRIEAGGSTACVAVAQGDGSMEVANLGDSGFIQLRPGKVHYASEPQTHAFNTPYQLSKIPAAVVEQSRAFGGEMLRDEPRDSEVSRHLVRHGDVLVFGSDGVWDNLSAADVLAVVSKWMMAFHAWSSTSSDSSSSGDSSQQSEPKPTLTPASPSFLHSLTLDNGLPTKERTLQAALAIAIAGEAKITSLDQKRDGPFAREVQRHYPGEEWSGGKVDDVCVVVAVVVDENGNGSEDGVKAKL